jgi:hypothetical protein
LWDVVVGAGDELGPAVESGAVQVPERRLSFLVTAANDEKYRHAFGFCSIEHRVRA